MEGKLYIFYGDDDYLVNSSAEESINQHVPVDNREFGLEVIFGSVMSGGAVRTCVDNVINSVQTQSFFGGDKVTWLRNAVFLPGGSRVSEFEESKGAVEKLAAVIEGGLQRGQILIITTPKIRKNSAFYKICAAVAEIEDFGSGLKSWEIEKAASQRLDRFIENLGLQMGPAARKEFMQRAGFDTRTIVSELEKVSLFAVDRKEITVNDVREVVSIGHEAEAWDVLDAFGARNAAKLAESIERLSGQNGIAIMLSVMMDRNIRDMLVLREAYDRKWLSASGMWNNRMPVEAEMLLKSLPGNYRSQSGWMLKKNLVHALNYSLQELRVARFRIIELREKLVSTGQPEMFLLQTALFRIMASKNRVKAGGGRRAR